MNVFVVDANVVVSAALKEDGTPPKALLAARQRGVVVMSAVVYLEIRSVLSRPKFAAIITERRRLDLLSTLADDRSLVEPVETVTDCRDPKDNRYLELALASGAAAILTGDRDLLTLDPWRGIRILDPAAFVTWLDARAD